MENNRDMKELVQTVAVSQANLNETVAGLGLKLKEEFTGIKKSITEIKDVVAVHEELIEKKIPLTSVEKMEVQRHVSAKVSEIARNLKINSMDILGIKIARKYLFPDIWRTIKNQYNVPSYHYLPSKFYSEILERVDTYKPLPEKIAMIMEAMEVEKQLYNKTRV